MPTLPQTGGTGGTGVVVVCQVPHTIISGWALTPGMSRYKPGGVREPLRTAIIMSGRSLPLGGMVGMVALIPRPCAGASVWAYGQRP